MTQVSFGPFRLDSSDRRLRRGADVIPLRPKTLAVLDYLVARPGRLVTKEQLLAAVWPDTTVTDTVLKVCVRELREALEDDPGAPRYLETAHRLGYRFIGQLSPSNLPAAVSSLVGRRHEIEAIASTLEQSRLVTLTGPGGCGKSRLALEAAWSVRERFDDGVWWVDLAPVGDEAFVPQAVALALGLRDQPGEPLPPVLTRFLSTREILLVVDNCEHLAVPAAALLQSLLHGAPRLRVLATSREPFRTDGEQVYIVPPLATPATSEGTNVSEALEYDAVKLFHDRARSVSSSFALSAENCRAVIDICRHLDGQPLAIELAAARVPAIAVADIASRLDDCLRVLASSRRPRLPRHQTLRAAIDWSYDLLCPAERVQLARLSVFAGAFTLEAAEQIAVRAGGRTGEVFDLLSRLIDKSLVFVSDRPASGPFRYRLLETVRQYANEKLVASAEAPEVLTGFIQYYRELAERTEPDLNTANRQAWLSMLELEHANLREAAERAWTADQHNDGARLVGALFWFWFHRGHWRKGRRFLGAAIERETAPTRVRARALLGDGVLAWAEGAHAAAASRLEESAALARLLGDAPTIAHALHFLAMVRLAEGNAAAGEPLAEEAVRIGRVTQDDFCLTLVLASYGVLLLALDRFDEARAALQESVDRGRQAGDAWAVALPLRNLAILACRNGEYDLGRQLLQESLRGLRNIGEKWFLSRSIETLAQVLAEAGEHERSAQLLGAAERLRESVGASILAFYKAEYDRAVASVREVLGPASFERCWRRGRSLSQEEAVDFALDESDGAHQNCEHM